MTKEVATAERLFLKARKDFLTLASQTSRSLSREAKRLGRELKRANARVAKLRVQQTKRAERMATVASAAARKKLRSQVNKIGRGLDDAAAEASKLRDHLQPVQTQLRIARVYLQHATGIDKLIARVEADWDAAAVRAGVRPARGAAKKPSRPRRKTTRRKPAARRKKKTAT
jgi:hypothetical protein